MECGEDMLALNTGGHGSESVVTVQVTPSGVTIVAPPTVTVTA